MFTKLKNFVGGLRYDKKYNGDGGNSFHHPDPVRIDKWKYKAFHIVKRSCYQEQVYSYTQIEFLRHSYF